MVAKAVTTKATSPGPAAPRAQASRAPSSTSARRLHRIESCASPDQVPRRQVRRERACHFAATRDRRSSSRASAAWALTTALAVIASAMAPLMRLSCALDRLAAGATTRTDRRTDTATNTPETPSASAPSQGWNRPSVSVVPTRTIRDGPIPSSTVSPIRSRAQPPRVILRTVAPAKLSACQAVGRRWTRANPSWISSRMAVSVRSMMKKKDATLVATPRAASARSSARSSHGPPSAAGSATAATRWPVTTGIAMSTAVVASTAPDVSTSSAGCPSQRRRVNRRTRPSAPVLERVMEASRAAFRRASRPAWGSREGFG